ncbi:hypothetical protein EJ110_NYTH43555 [Nymphaea thermarum]|nr:hypothetical protein EJ110_NYTH43555 [Nymphaea thermarum]
MKHCTVDHVVLWYTRMMLETNHLLKRLAYEGGELESLLEKVVFRFGKKKKLGSQYIGPFELLEMIGDISYILA